MEAHPDGTLANMAGWDIPFKERMGRMIARDRNFLLHRHMVARQ